jgi:cell division protein FtsB
LEAIEALKASNKSLTDEITKQVADVSKLKKEGATSN